ncbi:MAG TPA: alpha/beta hydrolase [bacterium]|nr:alpha/beta hydrolase [bacterium]
MTENLSNYCTKNTDVADEMISVNDNVSLRVITFTPPQKTDNPPVVFIAGWITLIRAWQYVLREMSKDFTIYYVETREKISSKVVGKVKYGVEDIAGDIIALIEHLKLENDRYILFGSSLGATAILESCRRLRVKPKCLVLIGPNAVFRVPRFGRIIIYLFYPGLYLIIKPFIKWYLKHFRLDVRSDYEQYRKYCDNLDAADPWKLKKAAMELSHYTVWDFLAEIEVPTLIFGASKDTLHEPENLKRMVSMLPKATYLDLETNRQTHREMVVEHTRQYLRDLG